MTAERSNLTVWVMSAHNKYMNDVISLFIDLFEKDHPEIKINVENKAWDTVWQELVALQHWGHGPDIAQIGSTWVGYLSKIGLLLEISNKIAEVGGVEAFDASIWNTCKLADTNQIMAIPWFIDSRALYYREDIFKKFNLSAKDLATWDSFLNVCQKINGVQIINKKIFALGLTGLKSGDLLHNLMPFIWGAGGDILTRDNKQALFNSEKVLAGMDFYFNLIGQGLVPISCLNMDSSQTNVEYFSGGNYAMCFSNIIDIFSVAYSDSFYNLDIAKNCFSTIYPAGAQGKAAFIGGSNLAIFRNSFHRDEAWEFIKFLTSVEAQVYYAKACGAIPANKKAMQEPFFLSNNRYQTFMEVLKYGRIYPAVACWGQIEDILVSVLSEVILNIAQNQGKYDPAFLRQKMNQAAAKVNTILENQ